MKISKYIWLLFIIALYAVNYFWLKINLWNYTGIVLGILVTLVVVINIVVKIKNRKGKTDDNFIFSEKTAEIIKAIDMSTQYEASTLSFFCLMMGMILFTIYNIFIAPYTWFIKVFISLNTIFGAGLMGSMLVTNYQQFISYKESKKMLFDFSNQFGTEILGPEQLKPGKTLIPLEQSQETKSQMLPKVLPKVITDSSPDKLDSKINERRED